MKLTVADRIYNLLATNPETGFTPLGVAVRLQINHNTVRRTIRQMDLSGELGREGGLYTAPKPAVVSEVANA